jgi:hypothetical protein
VVAQENKQTGGVERKRRRTERGGGQKRLKRLKRRTGYGERTPL